ncbi:MAG: DUF952 domain-containing protein [Reichenbachiella sp.]
MDVVILKCYLAKSGDEKNQLLLYSSKLIVIFKGKRTEFDYQQILSLVISKKKLIIPLVLGGIGTSFSMLALSLGWYHYQLNLFVIFLFFIFMYYGFIGKEAVLIGEKGHQHLFLINANKIIINEFIKFTKERIWKLKTPTPDRIYHLVERSVWERQNLSYHFQHPGLDSEGFMHCSTKEQLLESYEKYFSGQADTLLIAINSKWLLSDLKWEYSPSRNSDFPHLYGTLNKSAIIWIQQLAADNHFLHSISSES